MVICSSYQDSYSVQCHVHAGPMAICCLSRLVQCTLYTLMQALYIYANDCWDILPTHDVTEFVKKRQLSYFCRKRLACRARETHHGRARAAKRDTRARPTLCHVCVESDRHYDRLRLFIFVLLDNSKNQCHCL